MANVEIPYIDLPVKTCSRNEYFYHQGQNATTLFLVLDGLILVTGTLESGQEDSDLIVAPNIIGHELRGGLDTYSASAKALRPCRYQEINLEAWQYLRHDPSFSDYVEDVTVQTMARLNRRLLVRSNGTGASIAQVFLDYAEEVKEGEYEMPYIIQRDIASVAGQVRETVVRYMSYWQKKKNIKYGGPSPIRISKPEELRRITEKGQNLSDGILRSIRNKKD